MGLSKLFRERIDQLETDWVKPRWKDIVVTYSSYDLTKRDWPAACALRCCESIRKSILRTVRHWDVEARSSERHGVVRGAISAETATKILACTIVVVGCGLLFCGVSIFFTNERQKRREYCAHIPPPGLKIESLSYSASTRPSILLRRLLACLPDKEGQHDGLETCAEPSLRSSIWR
jgi:hypothetical protein